MIWTILFAISITQGAFLVSLIAIKKTNNPLAARLIAAMLMLMIFTNFGYIVIRTALLQYIPWFFVLPFGMIFLFGPLFYFYAKAVTEPSFKWKPVYWLHFLPYILQLVINAPMFFASVPAWTAFIHTFFAGNQYMRDIEKVIYPIQDVHLFVYLFITSRKLAAARSGAQQSRYLVPLASRIKWLGELVVCFYLFLATVLLSYFIIIINGKYNPVTNYMYTLVTSCIIYFVAYKAVLQPDAISPGFAQKYKAYMQFEGSSGEAYIEKLTALMTGNKIFTNPDLKLAVLSSQIGLPPHQLSKLINDKFGKSFNDYVNQYRVEEFIRRMDEDKDKAYTIFGMALDVGFNSKSSFNTAFKKITGKNPSDFRPAN